MKVYIVNHEDMSPYELSNAKVFATKEAAKKYISDNEIDGWVVEREVME